MTGAEKEVNFPPVGVPAAAWPETATVRNAASALAEAIVTERIASHRGSFIVEVNQGVEAGNQPAPTQTLGGVQVAYFKTSKTASKRMGKPDGWTRLRAR